jgi:hypothetical protein
LAEKAKKAEGKQKTKSQQSVNISVLFALAFFQLTNTVQRPETGSTSTPASKLKIKIPKRPQAQQEVRFI